MFARGMVIALVAASFLAAWVGSISFILSLNIHWGLKLLSGGMVTGFLTLIAGSTFYDYF